MMIWEGGGCEKVKALNLEEVRRSLAGGGPEGSSTDQGYQEREMSLVKGNIEEAIYTLLLHHRLVKLQKQD